MRLSCRRAELPFDLDRVAGDNYETTARALADKQRCGGASLHVWASTELAAQACRWCGHLTQSAPGYVNLTLWR